MTLDLLEPTDYKKARPFLPALDEHLAARAIIEGLTPGQVYVDDPAAPRSALIRRGRRFHLAGSAQNAAFNRALQELFDTEIYPQALAQGERVLVLYYASPDWESALDVILTGKNPMRDMRHLYRLQAPTQDWRAALPSGFTMRAVDRALLDETGLKYHDELIQEVQSEAPSVDYFLRHHFGRCLAGEGAVVSWCLSEYNCDQRCEVGIETVEPYQRRGLATLTASAFVEHALAQGITEIGWHCWASNAASIATALKVGFERAKAYPVYFAWFDPLLNLAINGNMRFQAGEYRAALEWYARALAQGDLPSWVYWNAACACARVGQADAALDYLNRAIDHGFDDLDYLQRSEHMIPLHGAPGWESLLQRLA